MKFTFLLTIVLTFPFITHAKNTYTKRKPIQVPSLTCELAYKKAKVSPSTGDVLQATDICEKAAEAECIKSLEATEPYEEGDIAGSGGGDSRYVAALCQLKAAYGGSKAVDQGNVNSKCRKAYKEAVKSPSTGDVMSAAETCHNNQQESCLELVNNTSDGPTTGDGRLVGANCALTAAYGAYKEVKVHTKPGAINKDKNGKERKAKGKQ